MTWNWFPFLVGAPIWASLGVALFAATLAAAGRARGGSTPLEERIERTRRAAEDPSVVSLSEYRRQHDRSRVSPHPHVAVERL